MKRKSLFIAACFCLSVSLFTSTNALAQKKKAPAKKTTGGGSANPFGGGGNTGGSTANPFGGGGNTSGSNTTQQPPASGGASKPADPFGSGAAKPADPFGKPAGGAGQPPAGGKKSNFNSSLPITVLKSSGNPLTDSIVEAKRNPSAIISNAKDRNPLDYDLIREDDAVYRHKIWKVIDAREKMNAPFLYNEDGGSQLFFTILFRAITEDSVLAFEHYDFRKPYKLDKFMAKFSGGIDTVEQIGLDGEPIGYAIGKKEFPLDSVYEFQIMEEIIFDKEASRLVHRIIGIAPMGPLILPSGQVVPGPHFPYFWIYYPDLRKTLAKKQVYNPKNLGARATWEDYLESHQFAYYTIKSSMDNVKDKSFKEAINDPMKRLWEGELVKEKIFSYEQGLWSY